MRFNNTENKQITLPDGQIIWLARDSTVVVTVWCIVDDKPYLLLGRRGLGCPNEVGKWNLPCGFLDWDETLAEAAEREVFEETGLDIRAVQKKADTIIVSHMHHPWKVSSGISHHKKSKQNIAHHYALVYKAETLPELSIAYCEPDEVDELKWALLSEIDALDFAFRHESDIQEFLQQVDNF